MYLAAYSLLNQRPRSLRGGSEPAAMDGEKSHFAPNAVQLRLDGIFLCGL
jgi:hypothetical protein